MHECAEARKQSEIAIASARMNNWRAININGLISTGGRPVLAGLILGAHVLISTCTHRVLHI